MRTGNRTSMDVRLELLVSRSVQQMARKLHAGLRLTAGIVALAGTLAATHTVMADVAKVYWTDRDNGTLSETDVSSGATQVLVQNFHVSRTSIWTLARALCISPTGGPLVSGTGVRSIG